MKKKIAALVVVGGMLLVSIGIANGQSRWAKYQYIEVPDDFPMPDHFITDDNTLDCCACHWNTKHDGPKGLCD